MHCTFLNKASEGILHSFFTEVFTASEGTSEGQLVGDLAAQLARDVDDQRILCLAAYEHEHLIGAIFLTELYFNATTTVYLLAPVAVATNYQRRGIGQKLIHQGCDHLRAQSVDVLMTYGDPAFYARIGFHAVATTQIPAPFQLSMPHGWLAKSLTDAPVPR